MLKTGVVSSIFRNQSVYDVLSLVKTAAIDEIEWDGDSHVPIGDLDKANKVKLLTEYEHMTVSSYSSVYKVGENDNFERFKGIVATAKALNANAIKVNFNLQKRYLDDTFYKRLILEAKILADYAEKEKLKLSFDFQLGHSIDYYDSLIKLLDDIAHDNVVMHYSDNEMFGIDQKLSVVGKLLNRIQYVKLKYCVNNVTYPLINGINTWKRFIDLFNKSDHDIVLLIDSVKENDYKQFLLDAKILKELVMK